ncbi:AzlC family ABC transporter permease [Brachybacterium sp. GPGPB12]|uniref:AzlC family ABC transporter permease n=1 Tax=Brachybacterium sp. GPGPB12 TaxID=3023517 RepID=UPI0031343D69
MTAAAPSSSPRHDAPDARARSIRRTGFSIGLATGLYGISFGALATASGLDVWQAMVLSAVMFTGGAQFAFVGVVGGGGSALGAALASLLLGIRNTLYGLILAPSLPRGGARARPARADDRRVRGAGGDGHDRGGASGGVLVRRGVGVRLLEPVHPRGRAGRSAHRRSRGLGARRRRGRGVHRGAVAAARAAGTRSRSRWPRRSWRR